MRRKAPPGELPPPLELECLRVLWQIGEGTVHDVREALQGKRDFAYTTVMTLLDRLARKGAVSRTKAGRSFLYAPAVDREALRQAALKLLVDHHFDGDPAALRQWLGGVSPAPAATIRHAEPQPAQPSSPHSGGRLDTALL